MPTSKHPPITLRELIASAILGSCVLLFTYVGALPLWGWDATFSTNQASLFQRLASTGSPVRFRQKEWGQEALFYPSFPPSVAQAALETGISPTLLLSSIAVLGTCNPVDCYVHEASLQQSTDTPSSPVPILGFARALSAATNAASGDREDMIGLEALFLGPTQTRLAILAARKSGSHSPEFFSEHEHHLLKSSSQNSVNLVQKIMTLNRLRTLAWPLQTKRGITSPFGPRMHPVKGQSHFHNGIDLRAPSGEEVGAIHSGIVTAAEENRFNGKFVRVDHGLGMESLYCHLSELSVANGDYVEEFQTIGEVGQTGQVTGPHLHYTLKIDGVPVNPLHYGFSIQPPSPHLPVVHPKALNSQSSLRPNS